MLKLSQLLDAKRRDSSEAACADPSATSSRRSIQSPGTANSSAPVSPAVSLFSASKGHARVSSSVSSLVPSPGHGNSMESATRDHGLTGVQEEPCTGEARDLEQEYFQHSDQGLSVIDNPYFSTIDYLGDYDLTDAGMDIPHSPKKRRSNSIASVKGLSRINSRVSTMSSRWKSRHLSEDADCDASYPDNWRSRTSSAASSALVSPTAYPIARVDSIVPPSPARTIFEERISESGARPIDIDSVNRQFLEEDDSTHQASTPLLPPFMGDDPMGVAASGLTSPLESPTVADISDDVLNLNASVTAAVPDSWRPAAIPSPPLSSQPSMTSFQNRPSASTMRSVSDGPSPLYLSDPNDEWANKLGHANFNIHPAPYMPNTCTMKSFCQLRDDWDLAQCNFAKHLVRTGEHYGVTSNIYKLTEAKWDAINGEWKRHHEAMQAQLEAIHGPTLSLTKSQFGPCDQVKIPRLHDNKFPELGDGEIVGPMKIVPVSPRPSLKRSFLKFFQDLIGRS